MQVLATLADVLIRAAATGRAFVVVDDGAGCSAAFADDLATAVRDSGVPCARVGTAEEASGGLLIAAGAEWRGQQPGVTIFLRTPPPAQGMPGDDYHGDREHGADIVIDHHDPRWPVIRHISPALDHPADRVYLTETQAFFAARAVTWDTKFGADVPAYEQAIAESGVPVGATVIDVGCGTGRALPALSAAVGPTGTVIGLDVTPEMLTVASIQSRGHLVQADARRLPLASASVDVIFAAGLVQHLPDPEAGLAELARVTRLGGRLIIFHPSGRAALAARHGRSLRPDEPLAHDRLTRLLHDAGWALQRYDDPPHRFFAYADRA